MEKPTDILSKFNNFFLFLQWNLDTTTFVLLKYVRIELSNEILFKDAERFYFQHSQQSL